MGRYEIIVKALEKAFRINAGVFEARRLIYPDLLNPSKYIVWFLDFQGDALPGEVVTAVNGTSAAVAIQTGKGGFLRLTTGTDDNGYADIEDSLQWYGDDNLLLEVGFKTSATLTTTKLEIGVTDANDDAGVWADDSLLENGTGNTATDAAIFIWDTDYHATNLYVAGVNNTAGWGGVATGVTIEASTTYAFRITLHTDVAKFYYKKIGTHDKWQLLYTKADACLGSIAMCPWVFFQAKGTSASRDIDVDYILLACDRA